MSSKPKLLLPLLLLGAALLGGCIDFASSECAGGITCVGGTVCYQGGGCVPADQLASCEGLVDGESCSYAEVPTGVCRSGLCETIRCGNGLIEAGEDCDEGDALPGDGCSATCQAEVCGNGQVDVVQTEDGLVPSEDCDDGNLLSLDGCSSTCLSIPGVWESTFSPGYLEGHAMVYDPVRGRTLLFGGIGDSGIRLSQTWEWNGVSWSNLSPALDANSPPGRIGHAMVYDAARARVVLFGGDAGNDTWEWDGLTWTDVTPPTQSPMAGGISLAMAYDAGRERTVVFAEFETWEWDGSRWEMRDTPEAPDAPEGSVMTYDPTRGRVVLVSGMKGAVWEWDGSMWEDRNSPPGPDIFEQPSLAYDAARDRMVLYVGFGSGSKVWEWDGSTWIDRSPPPEQSPPERMGEEMVYDSLRRRMLLVGGTTFSRGHDVWEWDGSSWTEVSPEPPSIRPDPARAILVYDSSREHSLLFGGGEAFARGETWSWDGLTWADLTPSLTEASPLARTGQGMAYDPIRDRMVLFGGDSVSGAEFSDTWEWDGSAWTDVTPALSPPPAQGSSMYYDPVKSRVVMYSGSATGELWEWDGSTWTEVTVTGAVPGQRSKHAMVYDPVRGRALLFGGEFFMGMADTWEWDGSAWTQITPANFPSARFGHKMVYDPDGARVLLFAGSDTKVIRGNRELWAFENGNWTELVVGGGLPSTRQEHAMVYDLVRNRLVVFGGQEGFTLGDTWEWDGNDWIDRTPRRTTVPDSRQFAAMAYDSLRGKTVLFGGFSTSGFSNDTWEWDGYRWSNRTPAQASDSPLARIGAAMAFDASRGRMVLFGGGDTVVEGRNDTWEWDGSSWTELSSTGDTPPRRAGLALAYDAIRKRVLLFGGRVGFDGAIYNDTWEWDGSEWILLNLSTQPPARNRHSMVYDPVQDRSLLFGGVDQFWSPLSDTWEWDGSKWTELTPPLSGDSPSARAAHAMSYDANIGRVLLFGGQAGDISGGDIVSDIWEWDGLRWLENDQPETAPGPRLGHAMAFDAARGRSVVFGGNDASPLDTRLSQGLFDDTWLYSHRTVGPELCDTGHADLGSAVGCESPNCWGVCAPLCPPGAICDQTAPRCGDNVCGEIESTRSCPGDCGSPQSLCGDLLCDPGESGGECPGDCS